MKGSEPEPNGPVPDEFGRKRGLQRQRERRNKKYRLRKWRRLLSKNLRLVHRVQLAASAKASRSSQRKEKR